MSTDKKFKYLNATIPESEKEVKTRNSVKSDDRMKEIEDSLSALTDMMTKSNRDNLDAMYNIDMDNLSTSLKTLLKSYDDGITSAKADIETWATAQEAGFSAIATWQSGAESSMSRIEGKADANTASISVVSQLATETSTALASFSEYVEENYAETSMIASVTDSRGRVTAASIVAAVNDASSSVMIDADRVNISGTTVLKARNGDDDLITEIDGNDISVYCNPDYGGSESLSRLSYRVNTGRSDNKAADIFLKNYGSGTADDSRFALVIKSHDFVYGDDWYSPSIKMVSDMSISAEAYQQIYLSATGSRTGNISAESKIIALRPSVSYGEAGGYFPYTSLDNGYVFCTDGIYYDGRKILSA